MGGQVSEVSDEHDQRPARGRQLERDQHPPHLAPAGPALGGLLALREAAAPRPLHARPADRLAADRRALRRRSSCPARSTSTRGRRRSTELVLRGPRVAAILGMEIAQADQVRLPRAARLRGRGRRREPEGHGAARPPLRRHPRGRPDRGGRPHPRPRRAPARDPARRGRTGRRAEPRAAPAPPGRGHDAGPRLRRGRRLELHRPRRGRPPADRGRRPAGRGRSSSPTRSPRTSR